MRTIIVSGALLLAFRSEAVSATAVYAVTTGGALYRSTDGAATWQPVPIQGAPAGVSSPKLAINLNGNIYLTLLTGAATGAVGKGSPSGPPPVLALFRSADGGQTWSQDNLPSTISKLLAADPTAKYVIAGPDVRSTVGRNSFRSPGFGVWNLALAKSVHFSEGTYLQVKADFYNVLNHRNFTISNTNIFSNAGVTAATTNPGYVQVADPNFLNAQIFSGGNRQVTLGVRFVF